MGDRLDVRGKVTAAALQRPFTIQTRLATQPFGLLRPPAKVTRATKTHPVPLKRVKVIDLIRGRRGWRPRCRAGICRLGSLIYRWRLARSQKKTAAQINNFWKRVRIGELIKSAPLAASATEEPRRTGVRPEMGLRSRYDAATSRICRLTMEHQIQMPTL